MSNVMVDLETMGNGNRAAIIAIGAVAFGKMGVDVDGFYVQVSLEDSVSRGLEMDASTVLWWLKQSGQARAAFTNNEQAEPLSSALGQFNTWLSRYSNVCLWGNGAAFDNTILSAAYRMCGIEQPWKFWNDRCYRTIKAMHPDISGTRVGTHHNALDDARSQAWHLIDICEKKGLPL